MLLGSGTPMSALYVFQMVASSLFFSPLFYLWNAAMYVMWLVMKERMSLVRSPRVVPSFCWTLF